MKLKNTQTLFLLLLLCLLFSGTIYGQKDSLSFLALGDSYTVGTSEIYKNCWPVQLKERLEKKKFNIKKPVILAGAGWTTKKLLERLEAEKLPNTYDLVSLLIGVNNQYRNQNIADFEKDFILLLDKSIALAKNDKSNVLVLSIPDWSVTPFAKMKDKEKIAKEIKAYNAIIKKETSKRDILYIDITKSSQQALFDTSLIAKDSLHPSKKMYRTWVKKIGKKMEKELEVR